MKTTTPQSAKQQVEQLVSSGKISSSELEQIKSQATQIAKALGV